MGAPAQAGTFAPVKVDRDADVKATRSVPAAPDRSRPLSLAEQGHTDRIIIVWKAATAQRAAAAARASALPAGSQPSASSITLSRAADPDRTQRLERIRSLSAQADQRMKYQSVHCWSLRDYNFCVSCCWFVLFDSCNR